MNSIFQTFVEFIAKLPPQLVASLPLLLTSLTIVLVMLHIAIRRNHWWNATLTVAGLNVALLSVLVSAIVVALHRGVIPLTPLLQIDGFALFYMALILVATLACATLSHAYLEGFPGNKEEMYLLLSLSALGGLVLVCSRHLAGLFIGLELLSVPVYGMVAYAFRLQKSLEAGIKYMVLSAAASAFMLFGMALLYAVSGTLSFTGLGLMMLAQGISNPVVLAGIALIVVGLGFKLSLAPFHLWTPDVYEGAPAPVSAYLATVSKVAVFAVLTRLVFVVPVMHPLRGTPLDFPLFKVLAGIAILSIVVGNLLALTQTNLKRLLGYSSIAHFGYLIIALLSASLESVAVYLATYVMTTLAAFGVVTLMSSPYQGKDADALHEYRGLFWRRPFLTAVLTVSMLSLAGIPMTAGFIGKFFVGLAGVASNFWWLLGALVVGSAIGLYYYLRVVVTLFLPSAGMRRYDAPLYWGRGAGGIVVLGLAALTIIFGLYPTPLLDMVGLSHLVALP
jgi:NADH-quinone oxidoreductase subunit N